MIKKIGLFGGSFDPVHNGHLQIATAALQVCALDEILFIPSGKHPFGKIQKATQAHRLAMLEQAVAAYPQFSVNPFELNKTTTAYTIDTIQHFRSAQHLLTLIIGADLWHQFTRWHQWQSILEHCQLLVYPRPGYAYTTPPMTMAHPPLLLQMPECDITSTAIRTRIQHQQAINDMVPACVAHYIQQHQLYKE